MLSNHSPVVNTELTSKALGNGVDASADVVTGGGDGSPDSVDHGSSLFTAGIHCWGPRMNGYSCLGQTQDARKFLPRMPQLIPIAPP
jgi:hypothetical protein